MLIAVVAVLPLRFARSRRDEERLDLEPATCGDPECDSDHGYTGTMSADDFSIRVSAAADGPDAVPSLLTFAESLSSRTHG